MIGCPVVRDVLLDSRMFCRQSVVLWDDRMFYGQRYCLWNSRDNRLYCVLGTA